MTLGPLDRPDSQPLPDSDRLALMETELVMLRGYVKRLMSVVEALPGGAT